MLNIRRKSGMASLRYTMLAVICGIVGLINYTDASQIITVGTDVQSSFYGGIYVEPDEYGNFNSHTANTEDYKNVLYLNSVNMNSNTLNRGYDYIYYNENGELKINGKGGLVLYSGTVNTGIRISTYNDIPNIDRGDRATGTGTRQDIINSGIGGNITDIAYGGVSACLRSSNLDLSICFRCTQGRGYSDCSNNGTSQYYDVRTQIPETNTRFDLINTSDIYPSGLQPTTPSTPVINLGTCPTIQQLIDAYGSEYNESLCYSAKRLLTDTGIVITTPQSIFELFPTYDEWKEGYTTYQNYCKGTSTEICRQAFSGEQAQRSIYNKAPTDTIGLYQYCHLQLEIEDKTQTTCVMSTGAIYATGVNEAIRKESLNKQSAIDIMIGSMANMENVLPTSGSVLDALKTEGEERKIDRNFINSIQELYNTFMTLFHYRNGVSGIIPDYITRIILVIVLFAVFKK